jgi:hypothetical protein
METTAAHPQTPLEVDTRLEAIGLELARNKSQRSSRLAQIHEYVQDRRKRTRGGTGWTMTDEAAVEAARSVLAVNPTGGAARQAGRLLGELDTLAATAATLTAEWDALEAIHTASPWTRYYPCLNADGHIHRSLSGCPTVHWDTRMGWAPKLSGHTVAEAVAELGETLCSVCFPDAPVEWRQSRSDLNRDARAAAAAEREAARLIKNLRSAEMFRDAWGNRVETVFGCEKALRDEVSFRGWGGHDAHTWHPASVEAAKRAAEVLIGRGRTQDEIDTIVARAVSKNEKEWR